MNKVLIITILFICSTFNKSLGQIFCTDFIISGSNTEANYILSQGPSCTISPIPVDSIIWNGINPNGFIKHTFVAPQTNVSIWYVTLNEDETVAISVNGGGVLSLSIVNGCSNLSGNIVGPYTGIGIYGDIQLNITSTLPFTEVTLTNTGVSSGVLSGDCNSVTIHSIPKCDVQLGNDTTICEGDTLTLDATIPGASYKWHDNSTNPTFKISRPGTYWVEVTTNNCVSSDTIVVNYSPTPIVNLGNDTTLCEGETFILDATIAGASYKWHDNSTNSTLNVTEAGTYWVEVTSNNCTTIDSIIVKYDDCKILELPNVFTPNNDGINDLLIPKISKGIVSMHSIIYNRWGNKIFETNHLSIEWDGQNVPEGTYFWIIYYTDIKGNKLRKHGYVLLIK